ncbi:hypothetical protein [Paenirhodobacter sp.]|uniref:hypothetical protein n=1 Tax=Paenirhodobacter sp. TaxID=1965326 RepID=UPI003B3F480E
MTQPTKFCARAQGCAARPVPDISIDFSHVRQFTGFALKQVGITCGTLVRAVQEMNGPHGRWRMADGGWRMADGG